MKEILLITSNVGSVFGGEKPTIQKNWISHLAKVIERENAKLVALNLQETGGKNFKQHSKDVPGLVEELHSKISHSYKFCRCFLDIDFDRVEEYTALSSIFFVHNSAISQISQYNFVNDQFISVDSTSTPLIVKTDLFAGGCPMVRKEKFSREFWPSSRWGRKGYLWTRWSVNKRVVDLVNIHLFHDENNLAFLENPRQYADNRAKALNHTLKQLNKLNTPKTNLFIFGDFNFRLDIRSFIKKLTAKTAEKELENPEDSSEECNGQKESSSSENEFKNSSTSYDDLLDEPMRRKNSVIEYRTSDCSASCLLRVGKKKFDFYDAHKLILNWSTYKDDDREQLEYPLKEKPIQFPPTYPWSECPTKPDELMNTRAPAWCDRILMNDFAWKNITGCVYESFALDVCTGDHKPVMLSLDFSEDSPK